MRNIVTRVPLTFSDMEAPLRDAGRLATALEVLHAAHIGQSADLDLEDDVFDFTIEVLIDRLKVEIGKTIEAFDAVGEEKPAARACG